MPSEPAGGRQHADSAGQSSANRSTSGLLGSAVLFWWGLVYGRYGRAAYGASPLYVFTTMVHTGVLGAVFTLSQTPFYRVYVDRASAAGIDATTDQQLAGLYMWVPAGLILTAFGLAPFVAWLAESERRRNMAFGVPERRGPAPAGSANVPLNPSATEIRS